MIGEFSYLCKLEIITSVIELNPAHGVTGKPWWNSNAIVFGNTITTGNVNLNGGLFSTKNVVYINSIATNDINSIIGMPNGAYGYGRLITITTSLKYTCVQFYIPHLGECIYIRSMADSKSNIDNASWRTISCPPSRESVKPS